MSKESTSWEDFLRVRGILCQIVIRGHLVVELVLTVPFSVQRLHLSAL